MPGGLAQCTPAPMWIALWKIYRALRADNLAPRWGKTYSSASPDLGRRFPWAIYAALSIATWVVQYPGLLWHDAFGQLIQASHHEFRDNWHSPSVTLLWSLGTPVFGQPAGALLIQCLLIMLYPSLAIRRAIGCSLRCGVVDLSAVIHAIFTLSWISMAGLIVKDSVLLGAVSAALALASFYPGRPSWGVNSLGALLLIACVLIRPTNFVVVGITMVVMIAYYPASLRGKLYALVFSLVITCFAVRIAPVVDRDIFHAKDIHPADQLRIFDVAGVSAVVHQDLFETLPGWPTDLIDKPWDCYTPERWDPFAMWGHCKQYVVEMNVVRDKVGDARLYNWWVGVICRHPMAYVAHRLKYFFGLLVTNEYFAQVHPRYDNTSRAGLVSSPYGIDVSREFEIWRNSPIKMIFNGLAKYIFNYRLMPIMSVLACVAGLISAWVIKPRVTRGPVLVALVASAIGLSNVLMLCVFGVGNDARYLMVTLCCGFVALFQLGFRRVDALTMKVALPAPGGEVVEAGLGSGEV